MNSLLGDRAPRFEGSLGSCPVCDVFPRDADRHARLADDEDDDDDEKKRRETHHARAWITDLGSKTRQPAVYPDSDSFSYGR